MILIFDGDPIEQIQSSLINALLTSGKLVLQSERYLLENTG